MKGKGVKLALLALSAAVLVFCVFALSSGFANEISHVHGFRQAQTLVAIRQMLSGGPWVFYELPVMGEPIRLPHEFPLFDWLVIALARFGGGSPLVCARIISLIFWIGTIPVSVQILRIAGASRITRLVFLLLYLNCPLYQHWSHAAMGETMVLFFTLSLILCASISKERNSLPIQAVGLVSGILAGMAKSLILFSYALPLAWILLNGGRMRRNHRSVILFFVAPIFAAVSWTLLADQWKNKNLIAEIGRAHV